MSNTYSLSGRIQWIVAILLIVALGLTGLVLDQSFQRSAAQDAREQLDLYFHSLLAETDCCEDGLVLPGVLQLPSLNQRDSGLYAKIFNDRGEVEWQSPSSASVAYAFSRMTFSIPSRGDQRFARMDSGFEEPVFVGSYTVGLGGPIQAQDYTFVLVQSILPLSQKISVYRNSLWGWLGACAVFLIVLQAVVLRWVISPLRQVVADLYAIQDGKADELPQNYPQELQRLTGTLNDLLENEKRQRERHRNSLADLAHSMKTPLAVLRSFAEDRDNMSDPADMVHEVQRLDEMVSYQLQRAVIGGRKAMSAPVRVDEIAEKITRTLNKVYMDKGVDVSLSFSEEDLFYGEGQDLFEVLGNLLENAFKYTDSWVKAYSLTDDSHRVRRCVCFAVEDNGPGIPDSRKGQILSRGLRLDTHEPGQGIGLAMVADVVDSYNGKIEIETNQAGGARFVVTI